MKHQVMKVFDCQDMPEDLRRKFMDMWEYGNNSFVRWTIADSIYDEEDEGCRDTKEVDDWLITNGATPAPGEHQSGEEVIILYWW